VTELILNRAHYERVLVSEISQTEHLLWIATADIKDLHIAKGKRFVPFLEIMADLIRSGVTIRLIHAKEPGPRFRDDFDRYPELLYPERFERVLCPRLHTKAIIIDEKKAYLGSANLTGAGLGSKGPHRRNFEAGIFTDDPKIVQPLMEELDTLWRGDHCRKCQRRNVCPDPIA
jgi:phosphatidylserine/phosphatidylglycerophosphate/cardiolipin synthase-like enzyme